MPRMEVALAHRVGGMKRGLLRVFFERPPHVGDKPVQVVHRLGARRMGTAKQDGQGTGEGFHVVGAVAKASPDKL